jgi:baseplate upper protein BppU
VSPSPNRPLMSIVEGWTGALPFTLKTDGDPFDLTGMAVEIVLKNRSGSIVKQSSSGITVTGSTAGQLTYSPATSSGDLFLASNTPYRVRFKVTALGKSVFFPNDEEELIEVNPV